MLLPIHGTNITNQAEQVERLRWRWREETNVDSNNNINGNSSVNTDTPDDIDDQTNTNVDGNRKTAAGELMRYLDAHLLRNPTALLGQTYSVEMHHPALGKP